MPIQVFWHNEEKTIVGYDFQGRWTWEEYHAAVDEVRIMMESVIHQRVDGIIDFTNSAPVPTGSLVHFRSGTSKAAANWGISVIVSGSMLIQTLASVVRRLSPGIAERYHIVESVEAAFALIEERRALVQSNNTDTSATG